MRTDRRPRWSVGTRVAVGVATLLLLPVGLAVGLFPLLTTQPFTSVDDLRPESVRAVRVVVLNRTELDGGEDIGPFVAAPADVPGLLAPLAAAKEVPGFDDARGPWLGEYRISLIDGRRSTIRLYWTRRPVEPGSLLAVGAVGGGGLFDRALANVRLRPVEVRLRFQIGDTRYDGGPAAAVVAAAQDAAARGTPSR